MKLTSKFFQAIVYLIFLVLLAYWSELYSVFRWDGTHWGSVLIHSLQICEGKKPYVDVPIYYGPLLFYVNCAIGSATEFSYRALGLTTAVFYALNVTFCLLIANELRLHRETSILFIVSVAIMHPFIIYPWYDYLAGMFFSAVLYIIILSSRGVRVAPFLCGISISLCLLSRYTYLPAIIVTLAAFWFIKLIDLRVLLHVFVGALAIFFAFVVAMQLFYGVNAYSMFLALNEGRQTLSSVFMFNALRVFQGSLIEPTKMFVFLASIYLIDIIWKLRSGELSKDRDYIALILFLSGIVNMIINSLHTTEWFRLVNCSPILLLLGINSSLSVGYSFKRISLVKKIPYLIAVVGVLMIAGLGIVKYPFATAYFGIAKSAGIGMTAVGKINGVVLYDPEQRAFYSKVRRLCGRYSALINLTGDVMLTRACGNKKFVLFDGMTETVLTLGRHKRATHERLHAFELQPGEVMFTYLGGPWSVSDGKPMPARDRDYRRLRTLPNPRADIFPYPINAYARKD